MDIKDLFKPETIRVLVVYLCLYLMGRSIFFLIIGQPFAYFDSNQYQEMFRQTLELEIPMSILTILWPLILAVLNLTHPKLRVAPRLFYVTISVHTVSCLIAAWMLYSWDTPQLIFDNQYSYPTINIVLSIAGTTTIVSGIAALLYYKNVKIYEHFA